MYVYILGQLIHATTCKFQFKGHFIHISVFISICSIAEMTTGQNDHKVRAIQTIYTHHNNYDIPHPSSSLLSPQSLSPSHE